MYSKNRLLIDAFDNHRHDANAPDIPCVSNIQLVTNFYVLQLLGQLPGCEVAFLVLPVYFDLVIRGVVYELGYHVVNAEAREQHSALRCSNRFVADEALLLDD